MRVLQLGLIAECERHADSAPAANDLIASALAYSLIDVSDMINLQPAYCISPGDGSATAGKDWHFRHGLKAVFTDHMLSHPLRTTAPEEKGGVHGADPDGHPLLVCTQVRPERSALNGVIPPTATALPGAAPLR